MQRMIRDETEYCTVAEAARLLRVSAPTVWRWVDSGRLPAYRMGSRVIRIRRSDLDRVVRPLREIEMKERPMNVTFPRAMPEPVSVDQLMEGLGALQKRILTRRRGKLLPPSIPDIQRAREERTARL